MRCELERSFKVVWLVGCLGALLGCDLDDYSGTVSASDGVPLDAGEHYNGYRPPPISASGGRSRRDASVGSLESGKLCESDGECGGGECFQGICVGQGALRFSLSWNADTDYDLHVLTPSGVEIWFGNSVAAGGVLDVDDCISGICRVPGGPHVENIFFDEEPESGTYTYWVHNWDQYIADEFEIEVVTESGVQERESDVLTVAPPAESTHFTYAH
jgi:hypothetical protein